MRFPLYKIIFLFVKIRPLPFPLSKTKQKLTQILTFQRYVDNNVVSVTFYRFMIKVMSLFVKISPVSFPLSKTKHKWPRYLHFKDMYIKDYVVSVTFLFINEQKCFLCVLK
jgi:hypothetical protein